MKLVPLQSIQDFTLQQERFEGRVRLNVFRSLVNVDDFFEF